MHISPMMNSLNSTKRNQIYTAQQPVFGFSNNRILRNGEICSNIAKLRTLKSYPILGLLFGWLFDWRIKVNQNKFAN